MASSWWGKLDELQRCSSTTDHVDNSSSSSNSSRRSYYGNSDRVLCRKDTHSSSIGTNHKASDAGSEGFAESCGCQRGTRTSQTEGTRAATKTFINSAAIFPSLSVPFVSGCSAHFSAAAAATRANMTAVTRACSAASGVAGAAAATRGEGEAAAQGLSATAAEADRRRWKVCNRKRKNQHFGCTSGERKRLQGSSRNCCSCISTNEADCTYGYDGSSSCSYPNRSSKRYDDDSSNNCRSESFCHEASQVPVAHMSCSGDGGNEDTYSRQQKVHANIASDAERLSAAACAHVGSAIDLDAAAISDKRTATLPPGADIAAVITAAAADAAAVNLKYDMPQQQQQHNQQQCMQQREGAETHLRRSSNISKLLDSSRHEKSRYSGGASLGAPSNGSSSCFAHLLKRAAAVVVDGEVHSGSSNLSSRDDEAAALLRREILNTVSLLDSEEEIEMLLLLTSTLKEENIKLLERVIHRTGVQDCREMLSETLEIEAAGGQQLPCGRRKTPGGVFLRLLRDKISQEDKKFIWDEQSRAQRQQRRIKKKTVRMRVQQQQRILQRQSLKQ